MKYSEIKLAEKGARKRKQKAAKDKASYQNPNTMSESDMTDHMYFLTKNSDKTQYISFTAIDKIGINPRSTYDTPVGIYCYPLTKAGGEPSTILDSMYRYNSFNDIPYMKNAPYIYMFEAKNKEKGLILSEYTDEQLKADKQKLYAYLKYKNNQITEDVFDAIVRDSQDNAYIKTPGGYLWNLTRVSSLTLSGVMEIPKVDESALIEVGDVVSVEDRYNNQYDYAKVLEVDKAAQSGLFKVEYLNADGSKTDQEPVVLDKNDGLILELYQKGYDPDFSDQEAVADEEDGNKDFIQSKSFPHEGDPVRVGDRYNDGDGETSDWYTGYYVGPEKGGYHKVMIFNGSVADIDGVEVISKTVYVNDFYPIINNIEENDSVWFALGSFWSIGTVKTVNKNGSYTIYSGGPDSTEKVKKSAEEVYLNRKWKISTKVKDLNRKWMKKPKPSDVSERFLSTQNQSVINEYSPSRFQAERPPILWTFILHKVLKYDYIDDSDNQGIIHENEKTQAVFFNAATLSVSETFINPRSTENPIKKVHVDKRPKGGKRGQIFPPDWNKIVQLFSKEKSNGWLNLYRLAYKNSSSNPITTSDIEKEIKLQFTGMSKDATQDLARLWGKQLGEKYGISVKDKAAEPKSPDPDDQLNNDPKTAFIEF